jgi:hypothetical protein
MDVITAPKKGYPITDLTLSGRMTEVAADHDMKASAWPLRSGAYSGCFALVAEYTLTGWRRRWASEIHVGDPFTVCGATHFLGLLGHYFPDDFHWGQLCHNFEDWHKFLQAQGYQMTRVYVFHHERKDPGPKMSSGQVIYETKDADALLSRHGSSHLC